MAVGWESYSILMISAAVALIFPIVSTLLSFMLRSSTLRSKKQQKPQKKVERISTKSINTRFFIGINIALILIALALFMLPIAVCFHEHALNSDPVFISRALVAVVTIAIFLGLGLFYAAAKGDLSWQKDFRFPKEKGKP